MQTIQVIICGAKLAHLTHFFYFSAFFHQSFLIFIYFGASNEPWSLPSTLSEESYMEIIIPLSDTHGNVIGYEEKMEVHRKGLLHLAFSVLVFNPAGELLLQKRAAHKYHSPSLWTNTCCGHPYPGEELPAAASRRLTEEMGFSCELTHRFTFHYTADFSNGLSENEIDSVFFGRHQGAVLPDPEEVAGYRWATLEDIRAEAGEMPENFTVWFRKILEHLENGITESLPKSW